MNKIRSIGDIQKSNLLKKSTRAKRYGGGAKNYSEALELINKAGLKY